MRRGDDLWEADLVRAFHHMKLLTPGSPNYLVERSTGIRLLAMRSARPAARRGSFTCGGSSSISSCAISASRRGTCSAVHDTDHKKLLDATLARDSRKCEALIRATSACST